MSRSSDDTATRANCIDLCDTLPIVLDTADAQASLGGQIDVCVYVKLRNA